MSYYSSRLNNKNIDIVVFYFLLYYKLYTFFYHDEWNISWWRSETLKWRLKNIFWLGALLSVCLSVCLLVSVCLLTLTLAFFMSPTLSLLLWWFIIILLNRVWPLSKFRKTLRLISSEESNFWPVDWLMTHLLFWHPTLRHLSVSPVVVLPGCKRSSEAVPLRSCRHGNRVYNLITASNPSLISCGISVKCTWFI